MKILRLTLRNLASLAGTHTVDFTREPLRSAGLFAISGPTGAGKSTLLDALCLALYDNAPRLAQARGEGVPDTAADNTITPRDPANLLRRGTGEGFAEVAFLGVDGAIYTARWSLRRARQKATGALQAAEMALYAGDVSAGQVTGGVAGAAGHAAVPVAGGRKTEVLAAIEAKVGLNFAQFTRAVLLAQNDFALFLKSEDRERALILQALTGTERFERLSVSTFQRHKTEAEVLARLQLQLAGLAPLDPAQRSAAEAALAAAQAALAGAEAAVTAQQAQLEWFQQHRTLTAQVAQAAERLTTARTAVAESAPRRAELILTSVALHEGRTLHEAEARALAQAQSVRAAGDAARVRVQETQARRLATERAQHTAQTAAQGAETVWTQAQPALQQALGLDALLLVGQQRVVQCTVPLTQAEQAVRTAASAAAELLRQHTEALRQVAELERACAALAVYQPLVAEERAWREALLAARRADEEARAAAQAQAVAAREADRLDPLFTQAGAALERRRQTLAEAAAALQAARSGIAAYPAEALAARRRELEDTQAAQRAVQAHLDKCAALTAQRASAETALARLAEQSGQTTAELATLQSTTLVAAESAWLTRSEALLLVEAATDQAVPKLRESLRPATPCPVCGAAEHPYRAHPPTLAVVALRTLRLQVEEKLRALTRARAEQTRLQTSLQLLQRQHAERQAEHDLLVAQLRAQAAQAPASAFADRLLTLPPAAQAAALAQAQQDTTVAAEALAAEEVALRRALRAQDEARQQHDLAQTDHQAAERARAALATQFAAATTLRAEKIQQARQTADQAAATLAALAPLLAVVPGGAAALASDPAGFSQRLERELSRLRDHNTQLAQTQQLAAQLAAPLTTCQREHQLATQARDERLQEKLSAEQELARLTHERAQLFSGRPVSAVSAELHTAAEHARQVAESARGHHAAAVQAAVVAAEALHELEQQRQLAEQMAHFATADLSAWLAVTSARFAQAQPLDRDTLYTLLLRDEVWLHTERQALDALAAAEQSAAGALAVHQAALTAHLAARPTTEEEAAVRATWQTLADQAAEARQQQGAAAAVVAADDLRRQENAALLTQLEAQRLRLQPWAQLNELIGSSDGARFRALAQRHTLDLLLGYANGQLLQLAPRYRLERLPESLNLIVRDNELADERRSVHTLSGGETFLVSLALALGLAALTSNRLRIESLFIDEGFGSLDPDTLDTVLHALMRLEAQGRKVGVISHVGELAEAIPVQIKVVKGRSGASRLLVPGVPGAAPVATATSLPVDVAAPLPTPKSPAASGAATPPAESASGEPRPRKRRSAPPSASGAGDKPGEG